MLARQTQVRADSSLMIPLITLTTGSTSQLAGMVKEVPKAMTLTTMAVTMARKNGVEIVVNHILFIFVLKYCKRLTLLK